MARTDINYLQDITLGQSITCIYSDNNFTYVGSFGNILRKIDTITGTIISTINLAGIPLCISDDDNGSLWCSAYNGKFYKINKNTNVATMYTCSSDPQGIFANSSYVFIAINSSPQNIAQYNTDGTYVKNYPLSTAWGVICIGNNLYGSSYWNSSVTQFNISTGATVRTITVGNNPASFCTNGTKLWVANVSSNHKKVSEIIIDTGVVSNTYILSGDLAGNYHFCIATDNTSVYAVTKDSKINEININTGTIIPNTITLPSSVNPYVISLNILNKVIWVGATNKLTQYSLPRPIICFKEDTKILTDKGYLPIQQLRKGHLVKTLLHGYQPIFMIGKKEIFHPACKERIKDQLYKCSKEQYPEVFEDLVITGCHCILVEEFTSQEEKEKTIEVNGDIYITDNKYRLPACVDNKSTVYETQGNHTIYHFALENNDYYMNYGVLANGLLVETTSKRFMNELTDMDII